MSPRPLHTTLATLAGIALIAPAALASGSLAIITTPPFPDVVDVGVDPAVSATHFAGLPIRAKRYNPTDGFFEVVLVGDAVFTESVIAFGTVPARIIVHGSADFAPSWNIEAVFGLGGFLGGQGGIGGAGGAGIPGIIGLGGGAGGDGGSVTIVGAPDGEGGDDGQRGDEGFVTISRNGGANGVKGANGNTSPFAPPATGGNGGAGAPPDQFQRFVPGGSGGRGGDDNNPFTYVSGSPGNAAPSLQSITPLSSFRGDNGAPGEGGRYPSDPNYFGGGGGGAGGGGGGGGGSGMPGTGGGGGGGGGGGEKGIIKGGVGGAGGRGGTGGNGGTGDTGGRGGNGGPGNGAIDFLIYGPARVEGRFASKGLEGQPGEPGAGRTPGGPGSPGNPGQAGGFVLDLAGSGGNGGTGGHGAPGATGGLGGIGGGGGGGAGGTIRIRATTAYLNGTIFDLAGGPGPGLPGQAGGFKILASSTVLAGPVPSIQIASIGYLDPTAGPTYTTNPYIAGNPTTPLLPTTSTGPDHFGLVDNFDIYEYVPLLPESLWLVRVAGPVNDIDGSLQPLATADGPMDYLFVINATRNPVIAPAIAVGDTTVASLTPIPLATRGSEAAFTGQPATPLPSLTPYRAWGTVIPNALPADVAVVVNGQRFDLSILPDQIIEIAEAMPCNAADLAPPFAELTFADITTFLAAFNQQDPAADLAAPLGAFTFADISAFLAAFSAGCP